MNESLVLPPGVVAVTNSSSHSDPRMNMKLADTQRFYSPPQNTALGIVAITTKRTHKSQAETENAKS